jgi:hypothetical protein
MPRLAAGKGPCRGEPRSALRDVARDCREPNLAVVGADRDRNLRLSRIIRRLISLPGLYGEEGRFTCRIGAYVVQPRSYPRWKAGEPALAAQYGLELSEFLVAPMVAAGLNVTLRSLKLLSRLVEQARVVSLGWSLRFWR